MIVQKEKVGTHTFLTGEPHLVQVSRQSRSPFTSTLTALRAPRNSEQIAVCGMGGGGCTGALGNKEQSLSLSLPSSLPPSIYPSIPLALALAVALALVRALTLQLAKCMHKRHTRISCVRTHRQTDKITALRARGARMISHTHTCNVCMQHACCKCEKVS